MASVSKAVKSVVVPASAKTVPSVTPVKKTVAKKVTKVTSPVAKTSVPAKGLPAAPVSKQTVAKAAVKSPSVVKTDKLPVAKAPVKRTISVLKPPAKVATVVKVEKLSKTETKAVLKTPAVKKVLAAGGVVPVTPAFGKNRTKEQVAADAKAFLEASRSIRQLKAAAAKEGFVIEFSVVVKAAKVK